MIAEKKKILVVDDEMDMRIFMSTLFETSGFVPITARNGNQGLQKAREHVPDLIFLDVMMPGEGGVYMYRKIKTDENLKNIPVVMLSGVDKSAFEHYMNMLKSRVEEVIPRPYTFVQKPPDPDEILRLTKSILGEA